MLYLWKWWILICMLIVTMIWILRPELLDKPIQDAQAIQTKVTDWNDSKDKEAAYKDWMKNMRLPVDCKTTESNIRMLECKNLEDMYTAEFERNWHRKH